MQTKQIKLTSEIPMTYVHSSAGEDKPLLMVFHGYTDSSTAALRRLYPEPHDDYEILAPNGLFPIPARRGEVWKPAFAWYFADFSKNSVLIHPEISAKAIHHLLQELNLVHRPKVLLGFSQGVFFIPFLLPELRNVRHIFGVGAAYRSDDYSSQVDVPFEALHGDQDEIISLEMAQKSFDKFVKNKCPRGVFKTFSGLKHTMNDESRMYLKNRLVDILTEIKKNS